MKPLLCSVALACALTSPLSAPWAPRAEAQFGGVVYDPANHAQNILQAVRALQEIQNQVQQLTHEIEMLENMARNLETLPINVAEALIRDRITQIEAAIAKAEGVSQEVGEVERDYNELYPETYGTTPPPNAELVEEARDQWRQSRSAYRQTLSVSAAALEDNETKAEAITRLVAESQGAAGSLQAAQAGNQLDALQVEQLIQIESMMAAHYRAEALDRARELQEEERAKARLSRFFGRVE